MPLAPLDFTIRPATPSDIPEILRQRRRMYEDMDHIDPAALDAMSRLSFDYLHQAIPEGSFRATILNVYTDPEYRRRGIARLLMETMIDWCKRKGLARVNLHASDAGRHLYESLGFEPSNEMRLKLR
jgi:GNAT superfamily N-acetyltransferase